MNERQWELYRLSLVEEWPASALKEAVLAAIHHRLDELDRQAVPQQTSVQILPVRAAKVGV